MKPLTKFSYQALTAIGDLRILSILPGAKNDVITGTLKEANFENVTKSFQALSYCWGSEGLTKEIIMNDCSFTITPNLHQALCNLRDRKEHVAVWVDQICINQNDNSEKTYQVRLMSKIYQCAASVPIWLGVLKHPKRTKKMIKQLNPAIRLLPDECYDGQCDIRSVSRLTPKEISVINLPSAKSKGWKALKEFLLVAWFSRSWIVQEALMAARAHFLWGQNQDRIRWEAIIGVLQALHLLLPANVLGCSIHDIPANIVLDIKNIRRSMQNRKNPDIVSLALRYKHLGAHDPRDKLYAFLSLSVETQRQEIPVLYTIAKEELYYVAARKAIDNLIKANSNYNADEIEEYEWHPDPIAIQGPSSRLMAIICSAGLANHSPGSTLPSWVPDWAFQFQADPIWTKRVQPRVKGAAWWPPTIYESCITHNRLALKAAYKQLRYPTVHTMSTSESFTVEDFESSTTTEAIAGTTSHGGFSRITKTTKYITRDPQLTYVSWEEPSFINPDQVHDMLILTGCCIDIVTSATKTKLQRHEALDSNPSMLNQWLFEADELTRTRYSGGIFANDRLIEILCMKGIERNKRPDAIIPIAVPPIFRVNPEFCPDKIMRRRFEVNHYLLALRNIRYRELFKTSLGRKGLGPRTLESGDEIWAIAGFKIPLIFKKDGDDSHRLIGECFIEDDDMMSYLTRERERNSYQIIAIR